MHKMNVNWKPEYLTQEEIDQVFEQVMKNMERMHITALAHQHILEAFPPGHWDTDKGHEVMSKVKDEWSKCEVDELG
jgi:mevalonate pyrophosphate decarboxylase